MLVEADGAISIDDALRMFTINAPFSGFEGKIKGTIEVGKLADFAAQWRGLDSVPVGRIRGIEVDMTILGGEIVF